VHVARTGERRGAYRVLVGQLEGKRPLGSPRHRWENIIIIIINLQKVGWGGAWTGLIWLRIGAGWGVLVNAVMKLWVP